MAIIAENVLRNMLQKKTTCPICKGKGKDPVPHARTKKNVPCRCCEGKGTITRVKPMSIQNFPPVDHVILCEDIGSNGELLTQYKALSLVAAENKSALESTTTGMTNSKRLFAMKANKDPVMQKCIDRWIAEGRGKA